MGVRKKRSSAVELTRGDRNIAWIQSVCRVPEGRNVGKPVVLRPWQVDVVRQIYNSPTRRAIISFGRKNGKTALAALLLLLHLCGPEALPNSQLVSTALSKEQAAILFNLAAKMVRMSPDLSAYVIIRDSKKELVCQEIGTLYAALSADAKTKHGLSPLFSVHDELGQVKGPKSVLYDTVETGSGAHDNPLSIIISTQAPTDADLLSTLIDDAAKGADPEIKLFLWTADVALDPFSEEAIRQANPAFGDFQNAKVTMAMAEDARRMPSKEAGFRNLILNQRVEANSPFVSRSVWLANGQAPIPNFDRLKVFGGLDLSETQDLTALILLVLSGGVWQLHAKFWLPEFGIEEKSRKDRVPYDVWARQGYIDLVPGKSIDYEYIARYLRDLFDECDIGKLAFDRYNWRHLKPWLEKEGFSEEELERFEEFGQGFASMSPALRNLESLLLNEKIAHGNNPVLSMCAANAVVQSDPAGNRKLTKQKSCGRIDGMVSLAMAASVAETHKDDDFVYNTRGLLVI